MGKSEKNGYTVAWIAGVFTVVAAILLVCAIVFALRQCQKPLSANAAPTVQTGPATTIRIPMPTPAPTLVPNPLDPSDFVWSEQGYLTCTGAESWLGVDVSEHQGQIDWPKVAESVEFAMIRLAYRGWGSEGVIRADARGLENLDAAKAAGLQVGVYFFSQAITVEEARQEAAFLLELLDGRELDLPVVFDWERVSSEEARTANITRGTLNQCVLAFCQEIEAAGYTPMVYFNLDLAKRMFKLQTIQDAGYDFWLAMYTDSLKCDYQVRMWQYTNQGKVPGIKGNVDLNLYFPGQ